MNGGSVTTSCGAKLISLTGPAVDKIVAGAPYYAKVAIPGGLYAGNPNPTRTTLAITALPTPIAVEVKAIEVVR